MRLICIQIILPTNRNEFFKGLQSSFVQSAKHRFIFNLHETNTQVKAIQKIEKLEESPLMLDGENLKLLSIKIDDRELSSADFFINEESLSIKSVPDYFTLETIVEINPEANKACEGLYLSKGIFATQCEAEGFRKITYSLDRPDVMTSYTVSIEADKKSILYCFRMEI